MKKLFISVILSFLVFLNAFAKTIDSKKKELKKIYEAGGISKIEYEKAKDFLANTEQTTKETEKKKSYTTGKKSKKNKTIDSANNTITLEKIEELGQIVKFDKSDFPEGINKKFRGCNNSVKCIGQKAGSYMWGNFGKSSSWGQKYPGKMIKSMAMYEVFYASKLYSAKKPIKRFKENKYKKEIFSKKKRDEEAIRSLFGMNKGRKNMREALGMDMETPTKEAIQKFWLLGEFLELGTPIDNKIEVNKDIKERQDKLDVYKSTISTLKKKLEERAEEKKSLKDKS